MNTKTQHTPGPWIVSMPHIKTENSLGYLATVSNNPEAMADARLISAAPELLEALKREKSANDAILQVLRDAYERFTDNDMQPANHSLKVWLSKARVCFDHAESKDTQAAIAKAEGKL